jgi:hypothetical protein
MAARLLVTGRAQRIVSMRQISFAELGKTGSFR